MGPPKSTKNRPKIDFEPKNRAYKQALLELVSLFADPQKRPFARSSAVQQLVVGTLYPGWVIGTREPRIPYLEPPSE
jgi:hypothetical protein